MPEVRNVTVAVEVLRRYKVNALVRLTVGGGKLSVANPGHWSGYFPPGSVVEFLVPLTSLGIGVAP